jgi:hypothetical protein
MTTSDWITLLGAIVAAIAIVVSARLALIAVKVQRGQVEIQRKQAENEQKQAQEDAKKDLAAVAQELGCKVANLFMPIAAPEAATASSEVMGLVIRANELADASSSTVTWYLHYSLAMAYAWFWEIDQAADNWKKALEKADTGHSRVLVLMGEAAFRYTIGSIEAGRSCFSEAEKILKQEFSGDLSTDQLAQVLAQRALQEYGAGQRDESARIYAEAWQDSQTITLAWRRTRASFAVVDAYSRTFRQEQIPPPATVPPDLVALAEGGWPQQAQQATAFAQSAIPRSPTPLDGGSQAPNQQASPPQSGPYSGTP